MDGKECRMDVAVWQLVILEGLCIKMDVNMGGILLCERYSLTAWEGCHFKSCPLFLVIII